MTTRLGPTTVPDDLAAALTEAPESAARFAEWITEAKKPEIRERRTRGTIERLL